MSIGSGDENDTAGKELRNKSATGDESQIEEQPTGYEEYFQALLQAEGTDDEALIRNYLLGEPLEREEKSRVEKRLTDDEQYFVQMQLVEAELIDDYVLGALSKSEREHFEQRFLSTPERRASLKVAESLRKSFSRKEPQREASEEDWERHSEWSFMLVSTGFPSLEPESQPLLNTVLLSPVTNLGEPFLQEDIIRVSLPGDAAELRLELILSSSSDVATHYSAELCAADGEVLRRLDNLQVQPTTSGSAIVLTLQASSLPANDYTISLYARFAEREEIVSSYLFTIAKRESTTESQ